MSCPSSITVLEQRIDAALTQSQTVAQSNSSFQGVAVAVAIGKHSEALASQEAEQWNKNVQLGVAVATNLAADLCGKCIDKSTAPVTDLNRERSETQENDYTQIGSVAISIDGGRACAQQTLSQLNMNAQLASLLAKNINPCENQGNLVQPIKPNRKIHKSLDSEAHRTKAVAYPRHDEKAVVVIDMGSYKLELKVERDGDVFINGKKVKSGKRN